MRSIILPFVFILSASTGFFAVPAAAEQAISSSPTEMAGEVLLPAPAGTTATNIDIGAEPRPIPDSRLNVRRVGPRFYPDPSRALDFRQDI